MSERKSPVKFTCNCGRGWDGLTQAHCPVASCHRHFGSVSAFDLHRKGGVDGRFCADPATLVWGPDSRHAGEHRLKAVEGPHGVTWVLAVDWVHPRAQKRAHDAATGNQGGEP